LIPDFFFRVFSNVLLGQINGRSVPITRFRFDDLNQNLVPDLELSLDPSNILFGRIDEAADLETQFVAALA
jgi:hypothetical protein